MKPAMFKERHDWDAVVMRRDCPIDDVGTWLKKQTEQKAYNKGFVLDESSIDIAKKDDGSIDYVVVSCFGWIK